ncbi:MAG: DUF4272 domain-containing protein [Bdellovibrionota bacterium]|nr:MAG: DUF4272 domain-containing protein [Bdellovibrionota bacterium]
MRRLRSGIFIISCGPKLLERIRKWWHETGLIRLLSPSEQTLVNSSYDNEELIRRMSWRGEAAQFLLWALGVFKELPLPCKGIDIVDVLWPHIPKALSEDPEPFFSASKLRPIEEVLDEVDIIHRMNWACTDQRLGGQEVPKLNHTVVWERAYASNWLVGYPDGYLTTQEWDEVVVDT